MPSPCGRRGDVDLTLSPALRFPQGSGYNTRVPEHPRVPPRLRWIFSHKPGVLRYLLYVSSEEFARIERGAHRIRDVRGTNVFAP